MKMTVDERTVFNWFKKRLDRPGRDETERVFHEPAFNVKKALEAELPDIRTSPIAQKFLDCGVITITNGWIAWGNPFPTPINGF